MQKIYHVSSIGGIKILEPRVSTHKVPYVYGTTNLELALLFGASGYRDFDGSYGTHNGKPYFYEAYKDAFKNRYKGKKCYIYEVDPSHFESGKTNFSSEVVSEKPVKVLKETEVQDLYKTLLNLAKEGKLDLKLYSEEPSYQTSLKKYLDMRAKEYDLKNDADLQKFWHKLYPKYMDDFDKNINK